MEEVKAGRYRHFKGNEYEVLFIAKHSETLEPMVYTVRSTVKAECGFVLSPCGTKRSLTRAKSKRDFPL